MDRIEIYTSKKKSVFLLLGSIVFVGLGIWLFLNAENFTGWRGRHPLMTQGLGITGILFFGLGVIVGIKRLIRSELALVLAPEGLRFNPNKSLEVIAWKDILGFEEIRIQSQRILIIVVADPHFWIEKQTSFFRKKLMQFNLNSYGSPFNIAAAGLDISHDELVEQLNSYLEKHGQGAHQSA